MNETILEKIERAKLEKLSSFKLFNEELTDEIFHEISQLTHLKRLDVVACKFAKIPESIKNLINLEILELKENRLEKLPLVITKLKKLKFLNISRNKLNSFPDDLGNLEELFHLDISYNSFATIPNNLYALGKLEELNLSGNPAIEFSVFKKLGNLKQLYLNGNTVSLENSLHKISFLKSLLHLELDSNNFTEFPIQILDLVNLQKLSLSKNQISQLPKEINSLDRLYYLDLRDNNFEQFPIHLLNLSNLARPILSGNPFTLNELKFAYTLIKRIDFDLFNLKDLSFIEIRKTNEIIYLKDRNNFILISPLINSNYNILKEQNEFSFSIEVFGQDETKKSILKKIREQIDQWIIINKEELEFNNKTETNEKKELVRRFFYYPPDKKNYRDIIIDFDRLLRFAEANENTYFDNQFMKIIPVKDLLDYIGVDENELKGLRAKKEWQGKSFLTEVVINNFKIFEQLKFNLSEHFNIILGRNGLGKTSILQAITLGLLPLDNVDKSNNFGDYIQFQKDKSEVLLSWGDEYKRAYIFKNELNEEEYVNFPQKLILAYGVNLNTDPQLDHNRIIDEILTGTGRHYYAESIFSDYSTKFHDPLIILEKLSLENNKVNVEKIIQLVMDTLNHYLGLIGESDKNQILLAYNAIIKQFRVGINHAGEALISNSKNFYFQDINGNQLKTRHLSEGYRDHILLVTDIILRIIAARNEIFGKENVEITKDFFKEVNGVILIDEFDRHLHPVWQRKLLSQFKKDFPKIQFILTTHNPMSILDREGEEILELQENEEKQIVVKRHNTGTKYTDIGMIYLKYFVNNIVSTELQKDIERFNELSWKKEYNEEYKTLEQKLKTANVGYTINDLRYWKFLDFLKRFPQKDPEESKETPGDWDFTGEDWNNLVNDLI